MKPSKFQLKNGMTVLLAESRKSPVVSVQMWVRTGSADETPAQAGISHFIEHLVFKGTRKFGVGEVASFIEGAGGELNAYTSFDQTVFHVTIATEQSDVALEAIAEMMGFPRFDSDEIDREREVVIEEIKRGQDSPGRVNSQLMFSTAFKKHTYGRPVIGYDRVIRKVTVKTLTDYYRDRYCPRNMFLVVTGDFDKAEMKGRVQKFYNEFRDTPLRVVKRPAEPKATAPRIKVQKNEFKETIVSVTWKIPPVTHKDVPALDVLALILGQGDSSRLVHRLRIDEPLVHSIGASAFTPMNEGLFSLHLSLDIEHMDEALDAVAVEMEKIRTQEVSSEELSKAITCLASEQIYSLETVDGLSRSFGSQEFYLRDPDAFGKYLKALYALNPADLKRIAKKYLVTKTICVTSLTNTAPEPLKKQLKRFVAAKPALPKAVIEKKVKVRKLHARGLGPSGAPNTEKIKLPGGGLLLLRDEKQTPTASVRVAFGGGMLAEPPHLEGLTELFTRAWAAGGKKYDEKRLNSAIDSMAAGFGSFAGRNTLGISAEFISDFDAPLWDILQDTLYSPAFPEEVTEREKTLLLRQLKFRKDNPSQLCMKAFGDAMFPGHPYSREMGGTEESLPRITHEELLKHQQKIFTKGNFAACVTGDFSDPVWRKRLESFAASLKDGPSMIRPTASPAPKKDVRIFQMLKKEQAHLVLGYRGLSLSDPRRWALQLMQAVLAGQGGRLFLELRDKKSLAYSVSPVRMEGIGLGYFGAYIACSPDKTKTAERMMREEFAKLVDTLIPEDELQRARNYLIGRTAIDLQRKSAVCSSLLFDEIYGLDSEESLRPAARYQAVSAADVRKLAGEIFAQPSVVSVVGANE